MFKMAIPESTKIFILDHKDTVQSQIGFNINLGQGIITK